jgi:molecular chaperone DnaK (HSP70)
MKTYIFPVLKKISARIICEMKIFMSTGNSIRNNITRKLLLIISREDLMEVFEPELVKIERLLLSQLEQAQSARYEVHKVVVVGGFAQSPAVQDCIRKVIHGFNKNRLDDLGEIRIIWPHTASGSR